MLIASAAEGRRIRYALGSANAQFTLTEDAESTLAFLRENRPDLMLIDAHLPDLRGTILCDRVKRVSRLKTVPLFLLVSEFDAHMLADARMSRADGILTLPFSGRQLRDAVSRYLRDLPLNSEDDAGLPLR